MKELDTYVKTFLFFANFRYTKHIVSEEKKEVKKLSKRKIGRAILLAIFLLVFMPSLAFGSYSLLNYNHIFTNQYVAGENLAKRNKEEAAALLAKKAGDFSAGEFKLVYRSNDGAKSYQIKPAEIGLHFDAEATVDKVWQVGRDQKTKTALWQQLRSIFIKTDHGMVFSYNEEILNDKIKAMAKEIDAPEKDYSIVYKESKFKLSADRIAGRRIAQDEIVSKFKDQISNLKNEAINFEAKSYEPKVSQEKALARLAEANRILEKGDLVCTYENQEYKLDQDTVGGLVKSRVKDDDLEIYLDDSRLNAFLNTVASAINVEPVNAKLKIDNSRAALFQISQIGKTLDKNQTKAAIISALFLRVGTNSDIANPQKVALIVETKQPEISESQINDLGIVELVGVGITNFKGSPANRVHNIQTGAAALNGILLKPGETFSTLAKLGEISDKSGYLPELVIKEDKTTPEFGGGLCQVSTTLFRAALNAGMKIVERQNHKYRVGYYEPPVGMDATIYDPAPDFKFQNNLASHVLVQSKVEGIKITFEFYGTKDSRRVAIGDPEVYDYVDPDPRINVETDTLQPGEEKQIEKAHQGASAKFHYKVERDGQILQETDFRSKYVPWPEKWLVGKQPA